MNKFWSKPLLVYGVGLVLIAGQFNWSSATNPTAFRNYALSSYFYTLCFFTVWSQCRAWGWQKPITASILWGLYVFPYHLVGLNAFYYKLQPLFFSGTTNTIAWYPNTENLPHLPSEIPFFLFLLVMGLIILWRLFGSKSLSADLGNKSGKKFWFWSGIYCLLLIETFLHLSLHSPYTYLPHFEQADSNSHWYHMYLYPPRSGAVNMDFVWYHYAEELFKGTDGGVTVLWSRLFPAYLVSPLLRFFHPLPVWISVNLFFWFLACYAISWVGTRWLGEREGRFAACLMASAQSMIIYVGQPKVYTMGIAGIVLLFLALELNCAPDKKPSFLKYSAFSGITALILQSYDAQPMLLALLLIAYLRKMDVKRVAFALLVGFIGYELLLPLCRALPGITLLPSMQNSSSEGPFVTILHKFMTFDLKLILVNIKNCVEGYAILMFHAFVVCLIPAIIAFLFYINGEKRLLLGTLFLPTFLTATLMEFGGPSVYTEFPRTVNASYPTIFLLCGILLARIPTIPVFLCLFGVTVYSNLDVFGFPSVYYYWFYRVSAYAYP